MADIRRFELDDVLHRPGTYVNPVTEVVIVIDDTAHIDAELFTGTGEGDWILVADEIPIDEHRRDELLEKLETRARRSSVAVSDVVLDVDDDEPEDDEIDELDEHGFSTSDPDEEDDY